MGIISMCKFSAYLLFCLLVSSILLSVYAPPVDKRPPEKEEQPNQDELELEYTRYLQEVVKVLEGDPKFKEQLEKASPDDIKSGKIAEHLDFLHNDVRSKLNEAKQREIDRLRELLRRKLEAGENMSNGFAVEHLDPANLNTFEQEDLRKLIAKVHQHDRMTTKDLDELDKKRQQEFKEYEMKKELDRRHSMENMTAEERAAAEKAYKQMEAKHNEHEKLKHPGSEDQLKDVWEDVDKMPKESFDLNTFFALHDLNGNGFLEPDELEALFQGELDKVYDKNAREDDMRERMEEMARMREHVLKEVDKDKDGLISKAEFMNEAQDKDFKDDEGWKTIDEQGPQFTDEELKKFEEEMIKMGNYPQPPGHAPPATPPMPHQ